MDESADGAGRQRDTRGEILTLLCPSSLTISDLARSLGISSNAVRAHLDRLEEDGLVRHEVVRRGVGKPAHVYELTAEGSARLSRAYLPLLSALLSVMDGQTGPEGKEILLREAGRRLAMQYDKPAGGLRERVHAAAGLVRELGGIARVREETGELLIEGVCCPLRGVVPQHPLVCKALETMLEEYASTPVQECCEKDDPPTCRLTIAVTG